MRILTLRDLSMKSIALVTSGFQVPSSLNLSILQDEIALELMEEAVRLDPLSTAMNHFLGNVYIFNERYDDGIRQADKLLEIDPNMRSAIELKGWATGFKKNWEEAIILFKEVYRLTGHPLKGLMPMGFAYGMAGKKEEAMECMRKIEQRQIEDPNSVVYTDLSAISFAVGDYDKMFSYAEKAIEKRTAPVVFFLEYPLFQKIKTDPRFEEVRKKAGL